MIDLTMTVKEHWRWKVKHQIIQDFQKGNDFRSSFLSMSAHAFTHVDSPLHCKENGVAIDNLEADAYSGKAAIIDLSYKKENEEITVEDLKKSSRMKLEEKIILLKTCWDTHYDPSTREFWTKSPYLSEDAALWLKNQHPKVVGFDFPQDYPLKLIDNGSDFKLKEMVTHQHLLSEGILLIEYLCNMSKINTEYVQLICLPLKLEGFEGAPARVVAII